MSFLELTHHILRKSNKKTFSTKLTFKQVLSGAAPLGLNTVCTHNRLEIAVNSWVVNEMSDRVQLRSYL